MVNIKDFAKLVTGKPVYPTLVNGAYQAKNGKVFNPSASYLKTEGYKPIMRLYQDINGVDAEYNPDKLYSTTYEESKNYIIELNKEISHE